MDVVACETSDPPDVSNLNVKSDGDIDGDRVVEAYAVIEADEVAEAFVIVGLIKLIRYAGVVVACVDDALSPRSFTPTTLKLYACPFVRPVTMVLVAVDVPSAKRLHALSLASLYSIT